MGVLLAVVLQMLLIGAELFVLRAFTRFAWTQEWALWLFWDGGLVSVLATAISAHLLCAALVTKKWRCQQDKLGKVNAAGRAHSNLTEIPMSASRQKAGKPAWILGFATGAIGVGCLIFSVYTIVSTSVNVYGRDKAMLRPMIEQHATAQSRARLACAAASTNSQHRVLQELDAILSDRKISSEERSKARAERAIVVGAQGAAEECIRLEAATRTAFRELVEAAPATTALAIQLLRGHDIEFATSAYPFAQGLIVWLFAFVGAATLHMMGSHGRAPAEPVPLAPVEPSPRSAVEALGGWLLAIERGHGSMRPEDVHKAYREFCRSAGYGEVEEAVVKRLTAARMDELGVPRVRIKNVSTYKGVALKL